MKSRSEAWMQQLVAKTDEAMNSASARLTPAQKAQFRSANATWEQLKSTYDNPQHPFYFAMRTGVPEQALNTLIGNRNPSLIRQSRGALGPLYGQLQRAFVDQQLTKDASGTGSYELGSLNARLSRMPNDTLDAILGPDGARRLKLLGKTAQIITTNVNPSGTAGSVIPAGEISGLASGITAGFLTGNPVPAAASAAELAAGYGTGRALTSKGVVDAMTRPGQPRSGPIRPSGPGAGRMIPLSALLNAGKGSEEDELDKQIRASRRGEYY
jgi:hypothetical protein